MLEVIQVKAKHTPKMYAKSLKKALNIGLYYKKTTISPE